MQTFTTEDIANYYDHTEVHYRKFWKMVHSMGLHYGSWDASTNTLAEAIVNTNRQLANLGKITSSDVVLDAGCGVGGSSIFLAKNYGCQVTGITLSERQVRTATHFSEKNDIGHLANFERMNYTQTRFPDHHFDVVWAVESMQTATDKSLFFKEMRRVLKPGGSLLMTVPFGMYRDLGAFQQFDRKLLSRAKEAFGFRFGEARQLNCLKVSADDVGALDDALDDRGGMRRQAKAHVDGRLELCLEGLVVEAERRLERADHVADDVLWRVMQQRHQTQLLVPVRRDLAANLLHDHRVLRHREGVRADGLAVPARHAREAVRDILDLDVER